MPIKNKKDDFKTLLPDEELIIKALKDAIKVAARIHMAFNVPMASYQNGKVKLIQPQELGQILKDLDDNN
jgi:hypothetical protein